MGNQVVSEEDELEDSEKSDDIEIVENPNEKMEGNNATDLKRNLRFDRFTECVNKSLTTAELKELLKYGEKDFHSRELRGEYAAKVLTLGEEMIDEAIQYNDVSSALAFFQYVSEISQKKGKFPFYLYPLSSRLSNGNNTISPLRNKKRERSSDESGSEIERKKSKKNTPEKRASEIQSTGARLPKGIDLLKCSDPFLSKNNSQVLKIFQLRPDTETTKTKFIVGELNNEIERVCIRSYFLDKDRNKYTEGWPSQCHFHLNNNNLMIRNLDYCIEDLTKCVTEQNNEFQMCHDPYDYQAFTFVIQKIGLNPIEEVSKIVKTKNYNQSFQFVVNSFDQRNKDLEETLQIVSISDQVSHAKIKTPCRGQNCQHITVFDLEVYLNMNLQIPQWKCPICFQPSKLSDIFIDSYFKRIIDSVAEIGDEVVEVSIHPDGTWDPCRQTIKDSSNIVTPDDIIIIDD